MKNKTLDTVLNALKSIIINQKPIMIISDSYSTFTSSHFEELLDKKNIIHNVVPVGDHHTLGVIDRFALTLKRILTKQREITKSANWINTFDKVIAIYNKSGHRSLNGLSPNQAAQDKYKQQIINLNIEKSQSNKITSDLSIGDKVQILEKQTFKKGSEPQYSAQIYTVESVHGKTINLTNGLTKKRNMLLKVHKDSIGNDHTITQKITKQKTIQRILKSDGIDTNNILTTKRR